MGRSREPKSTTVRALVDLLPDIRAVVNDPFHLDPDDPEFNESRGSRKKKGAKGNH